MQLLSLDTTVGILLIPVSMVAQIVGREDRKPLEFDLPFIRNQIQWREFNMPLIYSSEMLGASVGADDASLRSVILWPMKSCKATELFALTSLYSPKVLDLNDDVTSTQLNSEEGVTSLSVTEFASGFVRTEEKLGVIPNLKHLAESIF